ncbi:MAG: hypothetical protein DWB42_07315 [Chloroflexi bacterium]|nr:hypothetical protein [Chloroflexota bacterium]MDL1882147.1 hypothetical protein [Anaerolineae bacterium CFX8]
MSDNFFKTPLGVIITFLAIVGAIALCSNPHLIYLPMSIISWLIWIVLGIVVIVFLLKRM